MDQSCTLYRVLYLTGRVSVPQEGFRIILSFSYYFMDSAVCTVYKGKGFAVGVLSFLRPDPLTGTHLGLVYRLNCWKGNSLYILSLPL